MTLAELCALSYVLCVSELERVSLAYIQAAATARMLGGSGQVPDWFDIRAEFDRTLAKPPERTDPQQQAMLTALGLRR